MALAPETLLNTNIFIDKQHQNNVLAFRHRGGKVLSGHFLFLLVFSACIFWLLAGGRVQLVSGLKQNNASLAMNKILEILTQQPIRIICLIKAAEDAD